MTVQELHLAFQIGLDKVDSLNYPNFLVSEKDFFLNQAQDRVVKQRYGFNNNDKKPFESTQKRTDDLRSIVTNSVLLPKPNDPNKNIELNSYFVDLPNDYWFAINERATISFNDCNNQYKTEIVWVRTIDHDDYNMVVGNPFEKPTKDKVIRLMVGNSIEVIIDPSTNLVDYRLRYIRKPVRISFNNNITCELADHIHQEVVDEAIKIALEGIESRRGQTFENIINKNE